MLSRIDQFPNLNGKSGTYKKEIHIIEQDEYDWTYEK